MNLRTHLERKWALEAESKAEIEGIQSASLRYVQLSKLHQ